MAVLATIEQIHQQCRIDISDAAEDALLLLQAEAASEAVLAYTRQDLGSLHDMYGGVPASLTVAVLLMVGDFYANREAGRPSNTTGVPAGVAYLLDPYVRYICEPDQ